jgi:hypothetical protein
MMKSAFAKHVLQSQLEAVAVQNTYDSRDQSDADVVFNDGECCESFVSCLTFGLVWANNGDAISRA